jgi:hypothetical protein
MILYYLWFVNTLAAYKPGMWKNLKSFHKAPIPRTSSVALRTLHTEAPSPEAPSTLQEVVDLTLVGRGSCQFYAQNACMDPNMPPAYNGGLLVSIFILLI